MTSDRLIVGSEGPIGRLTLNNPERLNALSFDMWEEIPAALARLAEQPALRVVILSGAGEKAFAAGADISQFEDGYASAETVVRANETIERAFLAIEQCPVPTIAAIRGYCIGGGLAIALCCDLRIAAEGARFGIPPARLGLGYDHMSVRRVIEAVGPSSAKEILFTARQFSTAEATGMGLVNHVVAAAELGSFVHSLAEAIAANDRESVTAAKHAAASLLA
ncbi:MAG TPA: enoyl-CoA hydratase-related protein [Stellaceae bacterium]|nr:enoyl-CoA hydratase-related protein [Stellaceae bacterium]